MLQSDCHALAEYFRALADGLRLRMLMLLADRGELNVSGLARMLRVSQPLVSWHLRLLTRAGLVQVRKVGREVYCSLSPDALRLHIANVSHVLSPSNDTHDETRG
ncbi:MAG: helix-turn-helix transcriptional regulator [Chloroflexi bacterium]|nr:helix-turn-helix transcriptional regulator [Chloroflexota bacterium]